MKILSIEDYYSTHYEGRYGSGIFRVSDLLLNLLSERGHECISFTPKGSTRKPANWKIIESALPPKPEYPEPRYPVKDIVKEMNLAIKKHKPDLIINHAVRGNTLLKRLAQLSEIETLPTCITVMHGNTIGGVADYGNVPMFKRLVLAGQPVVGVSKYCKDDWNKKYFDFRGNDTVLLDGTGIQVCSHSFCFQFTEEEQTIQEPENYGIIIGRADTTKIPHTCIEPLLDAGLDVVICCTVVRTLKKDTAKAMNSEEYYDTFLKPYEDHPRVTIIESAPYNEVMDKLSKAKVCISTWPDESSGIVALESAERGVPCLIINRKGTHASFDLIKYGEPITLDKSCYKSRNKLKQAITDKINNIDYSDEYRLNLQKATYAHFNKESFYKRFMSFVEEVEVKRTAINLEDLF